MNKKTQCEEILEFLESGQSINPLQALDRFGCFRLASRISELKGKGHIITKKMVKSRYGKQFAQYNLEVQHDKTTENNGVLGLGF